MSWIRGADETATLEPLFARFRAGSTRGEVGQLWRVLAADPKLVEPLHAIYLGLMKDPAPLTPIQFELIAMVVSATNGCAYCVAHHGPRLAHALGDEALARAVARDYREANLAARDRVLLDAAVALTCEPAERKAEDVERLREYGFDDAGILKALEIAAFYGLINRLASGLGIELEPGVEPWEFGAQT